VPTLRGWLTASIGLALWGAGRIFGTIALDQIGFALLVLLVIAVVIVNSSRHDLSVSRKIVPERARGGQLVEVTLTFNNEGRGSAPLMLIDDRVPLELAGHARFALNGIESGGGREASYEIRPPHRGRYDLGPLEIGFVDPFGLAQTRTQAAPPTSFLVYPRVEHLSLPRDLGQRRSMSVSALRQLSGARGEDFYTMREYAEGDDLRKIHWPSTAKLNKPMIRQEETPWHTRATVVLDDHRSPHDGAGDASSFERCIEGAASLVDLYHRSGYTYRLVGALNPGLPSARGTDHYHRCLDLLAVLEGSSRDHEALLVRLTELESTSGTEGTLVVVTGNLTAAAAAAVTRCRRRFRTVVAVVFPAHRFGSDATRARWEGEQATHEAVTMLVRSGVHAVVLGQGESLASGWTSLTSGGGAGGERRWGLRPEPA
jgi:uncharacterized protein (DUF58 family)